MASEHVERAIEIADLAADAENSDTEAVLLDALSQVRKRGWTDE